MMGSWGMMGGWGNSGYGYGGFGMMGMIMPLIFGIGIILLAVYFFRRNSVNVQANKFGGQDSALNILSERYARGEIDSGEFESKRHDLVSKL